MSRRIFISVPDERNDFGKVKNEREVTDTPQRGCRSLYTIYTASYRLEPIPTAKIGKHHFVNVNVNVNVIVEKPQLFSTAITRKAVGLLK